MKKTWIKYLAISFVMLQTVPMTALAAGNKESQTVIQLFTKDTETGVLAAQDMSFDKVAISQVSNYVNVRAEANTSSAVVGKIYNNCAAVIVSTVQGEGGTWYQIESGNVRGYIKAEYFVTGTEAETLAKQVGTEFARIKNATTLRLREQPSLESKTLTLLAEGAEYIVEEESGDFAKISVDNDLTGYVSKDYIETWVVFDTAVTLEEEKEKQEESDQLKKEADEAIENLETVKKQAEEQKTETNETTEQTTEPTTEETTENSPKNDGGTSNQTIIPIDPMNGTGSQSTTPSASSGKNDSVTLIEPNGSESSTPSGNTPSGNNSSTNSSTSTVGNQEVATATRTAIVAYAKQFLGNPYVYGGTSLTNGADCSGFVQSIFKHFGITTGRSSRDQAAKGKTIAVKDAQPGDLLFYASGDYINHVAIYIGGNQVIHASNSRTGIIISPANYRTPCKAVTFLD
ncbi:MAG: NlpC/P60 family protein [bacterium]|nr:NlpC/P60 family protein [bacterium]